LFVRPSSQSARQSNAVASCFNNGQLVIQTHIFNSENPEGLYDSFSDSPHRRLGSITNPNLLQDVLNMLFDSFITDP